MKRSMLVLLLLALFSVLPAEASATRYTITFQTTAGSPKPAAAFSYDPTVTNSFSNFLVSWDGVIFDFTSVANTAGAGQIFNHPVCANGLFGAAATFYLLTECPQAGWNASGTSTGAGFTFSEGDTLGANLFDLSVSVASPPAQSASARGSYSSSVLPEPIYISDSQNNRIRMVGPSDIITTVAGDGIGFYGGDGAAAVSAGLRNPTDVAVDSAGNFYIADTQDNRIRKVTLSTGVITTVAGTGAAGFRGDAGLATNAALNNPTGVAIDSSGNLYIADEYNNRIRKVNTSGIISTVAGIGTVGNSGDGAAAIGAELYYPIAVAVDGPGNLYIADYGNQRVRKINTLGTITTVAGNGFVGYNCNNGVATSVGLHSPYGVAVDSSSNLYIADYGNQCIRKVDTSGNITTIAGNGIASFGGDGGPATSAELNYPTGVAVDPLGNLFIADYVNYRIRKVDIFGIINTVAGNGMAGFGGDNGLATSAPLYNPTSVAVYSPRVPPSVQ